MLSGLIVVINDGSPDSQLPTTVKAALTGGAATILYRMSDNVTTSHDPAAAELVKICHDYRARLIVAAAPELARDLNADGVHLSRGDLSALKARQILGHDKLIGVSISTVEEALKAESQGADYLLTAGPQPEDNRQQSSLELNLLAKVSKAVRIPVAASGHRTPATAYDALDAGARAIAVGTDVIADQDPARSTKEFSLLFNRFKPGPNGRVLTVANADSQGAGIQADIKTITLLGAHADSVITAVTTRTAQGATSTHSIDSELVLKQLETILDDIGADTIKIGKLNWGGIVARVARVIEGRSLPAVVDPAFSNEAGRPLMEQAVRDSFISRLLPQAYLLIVSPADAETLTGITAQTLAQMIAAGRSLQQLGAHNVLIKGGHLKDAATDVFLHGEAEHLLTAQRVEAITTHGSSCALSSAIATFLAQGYPLLRAVEQGKRFVTLAIENTLPPDRGGGSVNLIQGAKLFFEDQGE